MGDRSNVNFITEKRTAAGHDTYLGLSVYLHWGGVDAQLKALEVAGLSGERVSDYGYYVNRIVRNITEGTEGGLGAGIKPFYADTPEEAFSEFDDNNHDVLTFDLTSSNIIVFDSYNKKVLLINPLNKEGIESTKNYLESHR